MFHYAGEFVSTEFTNRLAFVVFSSSATVDAVIENTLGVDIFSDVLKSIVSQSSWTDPVPPIRIDVLIRIDDGCHGCFDFIFNANIEDKKTMKF